jgi:transcriptional regulator with PAS, ATPase and Fis domain
MHPAQTRSTPAIAAVRTGSELAGLDLRHLLEASFDGIIISDCHGRVLFANSAVKRITGADPDEMVGKSAEELIREGLIPYATSLEALRTGLPFTRLQKYRNGKTAVVTSTPIPAACSGRSAMDGTTGTAGSTGTTGTAAERPVDPGDVVLTNLRDVSLLHDTAAACADADGPAPCVFASPIMKGILTVLNSLATVDSTVLLEGETGVGKDILARLLHDRSSRRKGPFIKVNCGSLPESLLESELFGYEPGAFTGASRQGKRGLVEAANGGTFFLDEIEALPPGLQPKFLELLQDRCFNRVGGIKKTVIDMRVIASSNVDLAMLVREHAFREDLYYRLSVVPLRVPALRERIDDIIPLARLFLDRFNARYGLNRGFANDAFPVLLSYTWPGNIRELSNLVENLVVTHGDSLIDARAIESRLALPGRADVQATGQINGQATGRIHDQATDRINGQATGRIHDQATDRINGQATGRIHDQATDRICDRIQGQATSILRTARDEVERRLLSDGLAKGLHTRQLAEMLGVSQATISRKIRRYFGADSEMNRNEQ